MLEKAVSTFFETPWLQFRAVVLPARPGSAPKGFSPPTTDDGLTFWGEAAEGRRGAAHLIETSVKDWAPPGSHRFWIDPWARPLPEARTRERKFQALVGRQVVKDGLAASVGPRESDRLFIRRVENTRLLQLADLFLAAVADARRADGAFVGEEETGSTPPLPRSSRPLAKTTGAQRDFHQLVASHLGWTDLAQETGESQPKFRIDTLPPAPASTGPTVQNTDATRASSSGGPFADVTVADTQGIQVEDGQTGAGMAGAPPDGSRPKTDKAPKPSRNVRREDDRQLRFVFMKHPLTKKRSKSGENLPVAAVPTARHDAES